MPFLNPSRVHRGDAPELNYEIGSCWINALN